MISAPCCARNRLAMTTLHVALRTRVDTIFISLETIDIVFVSSLHYHNEMRAWGTPSLAALALGSTKTTFIVFQRKKLFWLSVLEALSLRNCGHIFFGFKMVMLERMCFHILLNYNYNHPHSIFTCYKVFMPVSWQPGQQPPGAQPSAHTPA